MCCLGTLSSTSYQIHSILTPKNPYFQIKDAINWHYFQQYPKTTSHLLNSVIKLSTEIAYELPLFKTIELLTTPTELQSNYNIVQSENNFSTVVEIKSVRSGKQTDFSTIGRQQKSVNNNLYVYVFHHSNAMDMRGSINYFGGKRNTFNGYLFK